MTERAQFALGEGKEWPPGNPTAESRQRHSGLHARDAIGSRHGLVETKTGVYILKVKEKKPARQAEFAQVKDKAEKFLKAEKAEEIAKAKALLKEAGCYPCAITVGISTSGSGQMLPLPMNEYVHVGMKQISGSGGDRHVFRVARDGDGSWLGYAWAEPGHRVEL